MSAVTGISAEAAERLKNIAKHWDPRMAEAKTDADLAKVLFDRCKAAAKRAQRNGEPGAMHELATALAEWAGATELREARKQSRHSA
ncbi:hypothetical protein ACODT4_41435 [Streptomyces sp. 2.9]|uniref:hypothetical protein n=1 Tax=Streptomyces tritrimontium TaxID=3406573 RepID=UPI003BB7BB74